MNVPEARILCVDADKHTTDWIRNVLKKRHVPSSVKCVKTGRDAFALLAGTNLTCAFSITLSPT